MRKILSARDLLIRDKILSAELFIKTFLKFFDLMKHYKESSQVFGKKRSKFRKI